MSEAQDYKVNRAGWPDGPWATEPDKIQWTDPETGLPCLTVRNSSGALCGYVGVSDVHPYFGKHYGDVPAEVHGGLTYSDFCQGHICHVPEPGQPERVWWLGFDCGHCRDLIPGSATASGLGSLLRIFGADDDIGGRDGGGTYRNVEYVRNECTALAAQIKAVA